MQATMVLMLINSIVFLVTLSKGNTTDVLLHYGALFKPLVNMKYEFWRIFTAAFLHANVMHLVMNMAALYLAGKILEPIFGTHKFLLIYFAGAMLGNAFSYALSDYASISLGASSATFGLFASVVVLTKIFPYHKGIQRQAQQFLMIIAINVLYSFLPSIDLWAHLGGLIGGGIATYCLGVWQGNRTQKLFGVAIYVLVFGIMLWIGLY